MAGDAEAGAPTGVPRRRVYAWFSAHRQLVDALLAALLWLIMVAPFVAGFFADSGFLLGGAQTVLYSALVIPLAWRRTAPTPSGIIIIAAYLIQYALQLPILLANTSVFWVVYALAAYGPRWLSYTGLLASLAGAAAAIVSYSFFGVSTSLLPNLADVLTAWLFIGAFLGISWLMGDLARSRQKIVSSLEERAYRLEMERHQERELAAADERNRIAREMHDIVAHSLSVVIAQADGARYVARQNPAVAEQTLKTIATTARESLAEMRRLLGVLRAPEATGTHPLPGLAQIDQLVDELRDSGVAVSTERVGQRRMPLPAGAELAAYRFVQQAFTNVLKHAGPAVAVHVTRAWNGDGLTITVSDDGRGAAADAAGSAQGHGLQGMRERVGLYGGTVTTRVRPGGGFVVSASIPYGED